MRKSREAARFLAFGLCLTLAAGSAAGGELPPPLQAQRRAAVLTDIGRLYLEMGTAEGLRRALSVLGQAARLDPAHIRARFWLGMALYRSAGGGGGPLEVEKVGRAGLEFEAVFKLSALERSPGSAELRQRAISILDDCARRMPAGEKRFGKWWSARRKALLADRPREDLIHVVAPRETFATIARKYYGDARESRRIIGANPHIKDPRRLRVGQKLVVPGVPLKVPRPQAELDRVDRELVGRLRSAASSAERRAAAERLARRDCLAAVGALAEALRADASQWVRAECARSLGRLADESAEPALAAALSSDRSARCRREAALALGEIGGRGSGGALLEALSDGSGSVAAGAARALGRRKLAEASGPLTAALSAGSEGLRRAAAFSLRELAAAGKLATADLKKVKRLAGRGSGGARAAALLALAGIDDAAAANSSAAALESGELAVRRAACECLAELAARGCRPEAPALGRLSALMEEGDPPLRLGAALAVARAGKGGAGARRALLGLAELLEETRAVRWGDAYEPAAISELAARALREITGRRLPADSTAWKKWLEGR